MRALIVSLLLIPALAVAKPPAKKDVEQTIIRMPVEDLEELRDAEAKVREDGDMLARFEQEERWAKLDTKAAKAWVDAGKQIVKALKADAEAAKAWARIDDQADLAARAKRAEANLSWREARFNAAKAFNDFQGARLWWAKAALKHHETDVELQRMRAYDRKVGGSADEQVEIGKIQQQLGKDAASEGKARQKMEKAEHAWNGAVGKANHLDPKGEKAK